MAHSTRICAHGKNRLLRQHATIHARSQFTVRLTLDLNLYRSAARNRAVPTRIMSMCFSFFTLASKKTKEKQMKWQKNMKKIHFSVFTGSTDVQLASLCTLKRYKIQIRRRRRRRRCFRFAWMISFISLHFRSQQATTFCTPF